MNKKKIVRVIALALLLCFLLFGRSIVTEFDEYVGRQKVKSDMPTETEIAYFIEQLPERTYYYYNSLTETQKNAYITVYSVFVDFEESRRVAITASEIEKIFTAVLYDNPDIFWVDPNFEYYDYGDSVQFTPTYRNSKEEAEKIAEQLNLKVSEIMSMMTELSSDYEKELFIHNYVCENTVYDESTYGNIGGTVYSALLNGKTICEGYSKAMQFLLDASGIDNYLVVGDGISEGESEPHMWNVVSIDDKNYHLDATWNDGSVENQISYFYFNVTDDYISRDHSNIEPAENNCVWDDANYFVQNKTYISQFNDFTSLYDGAVESLKNDIYSVEFIFEDKADYEKALDKFENDNHELFSLIKKAVNDSGKNLDKDEIEYYTIDEYNCLCLIFKEG